MVCARRYRIFDLGRGKVQVFVDVSTPDDDLDGLHDALLCAARPHLATGRSWSVATGSGSSRPQRPRHRSPSEARTMEGHPMGTCEEMHHGAGGWDVKCQRHVGHDGSHVIVFFKYWGGALLGTDVPLSSAREAAIRSLDATALGRFWTGSG